MLTQLSRCSLLKQPCPLWMFKSSHDMCLTVKFDIQYCMSIKLTYNIIVMFWLNVHVYTLVKFLDEDFSDLAKIFTDRVNDRKTHPHVVWASPGRSLSVKLQHFLSEHDWLEFTSLQFPLFSSMCSALKNSNWTKPNIDFKSIWRPLLC